MPDAIHSPTAAAAPPVEPFPLESVCDLVWQAADAIGDYCRRRGRAAGVEEYLAIEQVVNATRDLMAALDRFDPDARYQLHRGVKLPPPGHDLQLPVE